MIMKKNQEKGKVEVMDYKERGGYSTEGLEQRVTMLLKSYL